MAEEAKWYVVHTYSGYENTVKATIEKSIQNRHLQDLIHEVLIPMETVTEVTDSGSKTVERKIYPGYVLVKMVMTDEAWYIINSVRGVTGFVGADADAKPMIRAVALTEDEVQQLGIEKHTVEVPYPWVTPSRLTTVLSPPLPVVWMLWISRTIPSAWLFPCLGAKRRLSWSSTR